jgi:hypothetical protein
MDKICTDQLIGELVALLREADPDKFDEAVEKAKKRLDAETKQAHRNDLEKLFDWQITILKNRGVPEQIIEALQSQKDMVVEEASEMTIGEGNIPFLPVIKSAYLGYYGLMSLVRNGDKQGNCYLNPTAITDEVQTPDQLYYIYDVEDGEATRGKSPEKAIEIFKKQSRFALTAAEVVNLCVITDVLPRHHVWASGSRYGRSDRVPLVSLDDDDQPELNWDYLNYLDDSNVHRGSASCGSRLGLWASGP